MSKLIKTEYVPDDVSAPGETLQDLLDERGLSQAELAERTGRPKKTINEIVQGKSAITAETALQLETVLGVPANFWMAREAKYRSWLARKNEDERLGSEVEVLSKFPIKQMVKYGWINGHNNKVEQLKEVLSFFGVASVERIRLIGQVAFRKSEVYKSDPWSLAAWLRKGEIDAYKMACPEYDRKKFLEALRQIREMTLHEPGKFVPKAIQKCGEAGVCVVFTRELDKCRVSGATRWIGSTRPLLQMSLRYKDDGHMWFTLFHEAGHIYFGHAKKDIFIENEHSESNENIDQLEMDANVFANNILIKDSDWHNFIEQNEFSDKQIQNFAAKQDLAPGIVVGRLQHINKLAYSRGNKLKKKYSWDDWPK